MVHFAVVFARCYKMWIMMNQQILSPRETRTTWTLFNMALNMIIFFLSRVQITNIIILSNVKLEARIS